MSAPHGDKEDQQRFELFVTHIGTVSRIPHSLRPWSVRYPTLALGRLHDLRSRAVGPGRSEWRAHPTMKSCCDISDTCR